MSIPTNIRQCCSVLEKKTDCARTLWYCSERTARDPWRLSFLFWAMSRTTEVERPLSGFVDYIGLGRFVRIEDDANVQDPRVELRVGVIVHDNDMPGLTPYLKTMLLAVDGVLFEANGYVADTAESMENRTGVTWSCAPVRLSDTENTTFAAEFERRVVNVELVDPRLVGKVFRNARFNGKPTPSAMYGEGGGATGRISDMMGYGTLRPSATGEEHRWHVTVTFADWPVTPAWKVYDTLFINGVSATVVEDVSATECEVVVAPRLSAISTLASVSSDSMPSCVNIEIHGLGHRAAMRRIFDDQAASDEYFMQHAMLEGDRGRTRSGPNPWTGAVLVDCESKLIIGTASCNSVDGTHPEVACIEHARHAWDTRFLPRHRASTDTRPKNARTDSDSDSDSEEDGTAPVNEPSPSSDPVDYYGMDLYVTHTPCVQRVDSHGAAIDACVTLLAMYKLQLRRIIIGVHDDDPGVINAFKAVLPHTEIVLMPRGTELDAQLRWSLREYTHWNATRRPYVTALRVCDLYGRPVSRSAYAKDISSFVDSLRSLAQAVIVDAPTLATNPTIFEGLTVHEAIQLRTRIPKPRPAHSKHADKPVRHRTVKQPFPMRIVTTGPELLDMPVEERKRVLAHSEDLGSVTIHATLSFMVEDALRHRTLLADNPIVNNGTVEAKDTEAFMKLVNALWPEKIALNATSSQVDHTMVPRASIILQELGRRGIVTAFVDGDTPFIDHMMAMGAIQEMVVVTLPTVMDAPTASAPTSMRRGPGVVNTCALIACGQIGTSDASFMHYLITTVTAATGAEKKDEKSE